MSESICTYSNTNANKVVSLLANRAIISFLRLGFKALKTYELFWEKSAV